MSKPQGWVWQDGVGFLPFGDKTIPYDEEYFNKYAKMAYTIQGRIITRLRTDLVESYARDLSFFFVDVGVGCGVFVETMRARGWSAYGTDVNPYGVRWLEQKGWLWPEDRMADVLTFWDTLEHIPHIDEVLYHHQAQYVFVSMPIYKNEEAVFASKHYKPGEHCWYFTREGLIHFMKRWNYRCLEVNTRETRLGKREDIESFVFRRTI